MILLRNVSDISSDDITLNLEKIGYRLGVTGMRHVVALTLPYAKKHGQRVPFLITRENCYDMMKLFYSMAIINLASFAYEEFAVHTDDDEMAQKLKRSRSASEHKAAFDQSLRQLLSLIDKYGFPEITTGG